MRLAAASFRVTGRERVRKIERIDAHGQIADRNRETLGGESGKGG
jgi:hypothetical protein